MYDPIIQVNSINIKKKEKIDDKFLKINYILSIGRLTRQKNFLLLIIAFKEIIKNYPNLKLIILGEGEDRKKIEKINRGFKFKRFCFFRGV